MSYNFLLTHIFYWRTVSFHNLSIMLERLYLPARS